MPPAPFHIAIVATKNPKIAFGKRLLELRLERGLSQEKLAEMAGLHRNYVGVVERAEKNVTLEVICKLATALRVRPATLLDTIS